MTSSQIEHLFLAVVRRVLPVVMVLLLSQCATTGGAQPPAGVSDLENTWLQALIFVPDGKDGVDRFRMDDAEVATWNNGKWRLPLVLYMHGCTGLHGGDEKIMRFVAQQGFVVIAPDSFARSYRPMQCDPKTKSGGYNLFVYDFRQAEINYALQELSTLYWLQADKKVLFGASEGGVAVAQYKGNAFDARIITHWTCHGGPLVNGLAAPDDEAILSIVQAADPWYAEGRTRSQDGNCGAFFGERANATSLVLEDGARHAVFDSERAKREIAAFLKGVKDAP